MEESKSTTFFCGEEIIEIHPGQLNQLKEVASKAPLRRARLCLHRDHRDKVQEMVIVFCKDSYVRPHRHLNKSESFHVIEGELLVVIFNEEGKVTKKIKMSPYGRDETFLYRLSTGLWHTVVPLSEFVVIHETATGPFIKDENNMANWAPDGNDTEEIRAFIFRIIGASGI